MIKIVLVIARSRIAKYFLISTIFGIKLYQITRNLDSHWIKINIFPIFIIVVFAWSNLHESYSGRINHQNVVGVSFLSRVHLLHHFKSPVASKTMHATTNFLHTYWQHVSTSTSRDDDASLARANGRTNERCIMKWERVLNESSCVNVVVGKQSNDLIEKTLSYLTCARR